MLTGDIPKYISLLVESEATSFSKMLDGITSPDSPFICERIELLISEFGKNYGIYFSILQLIASEKLYKARSIPSLGKIRVHTL